ncbi:MAG: hypothetical protein II715_04395 [Clostridia bacterium]|nr:hypothetical protein [Clostridia bacterium]
MDRSTWTKIAFGLLIAAIVARLVLGFFPVPLPTEPYSPDGEPGVLQETTITEIKRCFFAVSPGSSGDYFYLVKTSDGKEGFVKSSGNFEDQVLVQPPENDSDRLDGISYWVRLTGMSVKLPDSAAGTSEEQSRFWEKITFIPSYLETFGGNVHEAYAAFSGKTALDINYKDVTKENPACFWVSIVCAVFFVWLVALLLAEYFSGSRRNRRKKGEPPEKAE